MHKRKPKKLSARIGLITVIPVIALSVLAGAVHILPKSEGPKRIAVESHSAAPLVPPELLDAAKWTYIIESAIRNQRRADMIRRIDGYLHNCGSPMEGLGAAFYDSAARYGIEPRLAVAIAQAESSAGLACFAPHNYWGGLSFPRGFSSWEESINVHLDWLHRYFGSPQTSYQCPGYCVPNHPWMENVNRVMESI